MTESKHRGVVPAMSIGSYAFLRLGVTMHCAPKSPHFLTVVCAYVCGLADRLSGNRSRCDNHLHSKSDRLCRHRRRVVSFCLPIRKKLPNVNFPSRCFVSARLRKPVTGCGDAFCGDGPAHFLRLAIKRGSDGLLMTAECTTADELQPLSGNRCAMRIRKAARRREGTAPDAEKGETDASETDCPIDRVADASSRAVRESAVTHSARLSFSDINQQWSSRPRERALPLTSAVLLSRTGHFRLVSLH
jgi:hypothetical protein